MLLAFVALNVGVAMAQPRAVKKAEKARAKKNELKKRRWKKVSKRREKERLIFSRLMFRNE
jgi:hypothetical protein